MFELLSCSCGRRQDGEDLRWRDGEIERRKVRLACSLARGLVALSYNTHLGLMSSSGKLFFSLCGWIVFLSLPSPHVNVLIGSAMLCSLTCVRVTGTGSEDRVQVVKFVSKCLSLLSHLTTSVLFESHTLSSF